jgi:hypothetical protein
MLATLSTKRTTQSAWEAIKSHRLCRGEANVKQLRK